MQSTTRSTTTITDDEFRARRQGTIQPFINDYLHRAGLWKILTLLLVVAKQGKVLIGAFTSCRICHHLFQRMGAIAPSLISRISSLS